MFNGTIKPVFNDEIIAEYTDVLHRPKFRMRDEDINLIINYIKKQSEIFSFYKHVVRLYPQVVVFLYFYLYQSHPKVCLV